MTEYSGLGKGHGRLISGHWIYLRELHVGQNMCEEKETATDFGFVACVTR